MSQLTVELFLRLNGWELDTAAPLLGGYCTDSDSKWRHESKMVALISLYNRRKSPHIIYDSCPPQPFNFYFMCRLNITKKRSHIEGLYFCNVSCNLAESSFELLWLVLLW